MWKSMVAPAPPKPRSAGPGYEVRLVVARVLQAGPQRDEEKDRRLTERADRLQGNVGT